MHLRMPKFRPGACYASTAPRADRMHWAQPYDALQMEEPVDMGVLGTAAASQQTQQENRPPPRQLRRTQR